MSQLSHAVSIHPYFSVASGQADAFWAIVRQLVEKTSSEEGCLYYDFSRNGDVGFCREGYVDAAALLSHLGNVDELIQKALTISSIQRVEVHGPADQLALLKEPLAGLNPDFYERVVGRE